MTEVASPDPYGIASYVEGTDIIITPEDKYTAVAAAKFLDDFIAKHLSDRTGSNKNIIENALAEACAKGTSAKRFNSRTTISVGTSSFTLGDFVAALPSDRDNSLRVWAESHAHFADRTYFLIKAKEQLRIDMCRANSCSFEMAPVSFDYAGSLSPNIYKGLGSVEREFIALNTARKTGPPRQHVFESQRADIGLPTQPAPGDVKSGTARRALPYSNNGVDGLYGR